ncbi:hypothetical protein ACFQ1S_00115 [Kibdelosporangium lantanae]|uniref:DNA-binding protein n=1 Tax=Kibdelosporangium lantanae TaxID=1497396 RepID=A0ABW3M526_9PSEU
MTITAELERLESHLNTIEEIEDIAAATDDSTARTRLAELADRMLDQLPAVRVTTAATLLKISRPTTYAWVGEGVLQTVDTGPSDRQLLEPRRLHRVWHLLRQVRAEGVKNSRLLDAIWFRLQDQAVLDRPDLLESLEQMRRGEGKEI